MKQKLLLMLVMAISLTAFVPGQVSAETVRLSWPPNSARKIGRYDCLVEFTYATRTGNVATAKFRDVSYVNGYAGCGYGTSIAVKSRYVTTGQIRVSPVCELHLQSSTCQEPGWTASKRLNSTAFGAIIKLCGRNVNVCVTYDVDAFY